MDNNIKLINQTAFESNTLNNNKKIIDFQSDTQPSYHDIQQSIQRQNQGALGKKVPGKLDDNDRFAENKSNKPVNNSITTARKNTHSLNSKNNTGSSPKSEGVHETEQKSADENTTNSEKNARATDETNAQNTSSQVSKNNNDRASESAGNQASDPVKTQPGEEANEEANEAASDAANEIAVSESVDITDQPLVLSDDKDIIKTEDSEEQTVQATDANFETPVVPMMLNANQYDLEESKDSKVQNASLKRFDHIALQGQTSLRDYILKNQINASANGVNDQSVLNAGTQGKTDGASIDQTLTNVPLEEVLVPKQIPMDTHAKVSDKQIAEIKADLTNVNIEQAFVTQMKPTEKSNDVKSNNISLSEINLSTMAKVNQSTISTALPTVDRALLKPTGHQAYQNPVQDQNELSNRIMLLINRNETSAKIKIDPPDLGHLDIKVIHNQGNAHISFITQTSMAKDAIELQLPDLRQQLAQQGINLGDVSVQHQAPQQGGDQNDSQGSGRQSGNGISDPLSQISDTDTMQSIVLKPPKSTLIDYYA